MCTANSENERTGQLVDRHSIAPNTGCIVSASVVLVENPTLRASLQVRHLLTGHITQDDQRVFAPRYPLCANAGLIVQHTGGG